MPSRTTPLLIVEDDLALSGYLAASLRDEGFEPAQAQDRESAQHILETGSVPSLILLDLGLPPHPSTMSEGLALLEDILRRRSDAKIIVLTGQDETAAAREAVRRGAFDFLVKPMAIVAILQALRRAELFAREEENMAAQGEARLHLTTRFGEGPKEAASAAEEQLIRRVLAESGYNVAEAGRRLGLAREHVYYYLNKYGIRRPG